MSTSEPPTPESVERWDILQPVEKSLKASVPELIERDTLPNFTREMLRVQWRAADPIELYVIRPTGVERPPVVLFLYGFPADSDRFRNNELCEYLSKNGFAAVGFASALTGQRYHDRPMKEWFVSELQESLAATVHDVQMVLRYLESRGDLDMNRVGMFGEGSGGTIAILSAATDSRIKAVDTLDPWGDWPTWLEKSPQVPDNERGAYLTAEFLAGVAPLDPVRWIPLLGSRPFRLEQTLFTTITPEQARRRIADALPSGHERVEYNDLEQYKKEAGRILDWLKSRLQPERAQASSPR